MCWQSPDSLAVLVWALWIQDSLRSQKGWPPWFLKESGSPGRRLNCKGGFFSKIERPDSWDRWWLLVHVAYLAQMTELFIWEETRLTSRGVVQTHVLSLGTQSKYICRRQSKDEITRALKACEASGFQTVAELKQVVRDMKDCANACQPLAEQDVSPLKIFQHCFSFSLSLSLSFSLLYLFLFLLSFVFLSFFSFLFFSFLSFFLSFLFSCFSCLSLFQDKQVVQEAVNVTQLFEEASSSLPPACAKNVSATAAPATAPQNGLEE